MFNLKKIREFKALSHKSIDGLIKLKSVKNKGYFKTGYQNCIDNNFNYHKSGIKIVDNIKNAGDKFLFYLGCNKCLIDCNKEDRIQLDTIFDFTNNDKFFLDYFKTNPDFFIDDDNITEENYKFKNASQRYWFSRGVSDAVRLEKSDDLLFENQIEFEQSLEDQTFLYVKDSNPELIEKIREECSQYYYLGKEFGFNIMDFLGFSLRKIPSWISLNH